MKYKIWTWCCLETVEVPSNLGQLLQDFLDLIGCWVKFRKTITQWKFQQRVTLTVKLSLIRWSLQWIQRTRVNYSLHSSSSWDKKEMLEHFREQAKLWWILLEKMGWAPCQVVNGPIGRWDLLVQLTLQAILFSILSPKHKCLVRSTAILQQDLSQLVNLTSQRCTTLRYSNHLMVWRPMARLSQQSTRVWDLNKSKESNTLLAPHQNFQIYHAKDLAMSTCKSRAKFLELLRM